MPDNSEPKSPDPRRFYVVWCPQGGPPVVRYPTFGGARTAAVRLTLKYPERDFFVLASCWGRIGTPAVAVEAEGSDPQMAEPEATP